MKKQLLALLGLGLLLATVSAYAQTINVKANIPFNFVVDKSTLPAGEYTIQSLSLSEKALAIRSADQDAKAMVLSMSCRSLNPSEQTKLVFHRYEDRYFLAQIWVAGDNSGRELPKSRHETEVARDYPVQNVILVAALR